MRAALDLDATLADTISPGSEWIEIDGERKHVMSYLDDFLFAPERANSPVRTLSGGERNRLLLARLFALPANVLVLDEPTNDLDIDTLELLEELLQDYDGTVFLVSHDRRFLDNVVTSTIAWEGDPASAAGRGCGANTRAATRTGSCSANARVAARQPPHRPRAVAAAPAAPRTPARAPSSATRSGASSMRCPARIEALEVEQSSLAERLAEHALYTDEPQWAPTCRRATRRSKTNCWRPRALGGAVGPLITRARPPAPVSPRRWSPPGGCA